MARIFMRMLALLVMVVVLGGTSAVAQSATEIPDEWFSRAPTSERIKAVQAAVARSGLTVVSTRLFEGAIRAYELRQEDAAVAWFYMARWCELLGRSQSSLGKQWLAAVSRNKGVYSGVEAASVKSLPDAPMSALISEDTAAWLLGDRAFSESFFDLITAGDYPPRVLQIIEELRHADQRRFEDYEQLALAIALVYDQAPPPYWPHWQVTTAVLPRRLPAPLDGFVYLSEADRRGATLQKLGALSAAELKYVVDIAVGLPELQWVQRSVKVPLKDWVKTYESVRYRSDRIDADQYVWPGEHYDLPEILSEGGICVDQAYFATQAGKARGVPTLLFNGAGKDGRHAWFGYLGTNQKWVLDAGRYAEQRYVTGVSLDPQTWGPLSDHELSFLNEGFRRLQPYRSSRQHEVFADLYLRMGNKAAAATAARKAVNFERRNIAAWDILVAASADAPPRTFEVLLREAAQAMQRYPDLNARFVHELAASLRARGESSAADFEERSLVRRGQVGGRSDFGVDHAVDVIGQTASAELVTIHLQLLRKYGTDAPTDFYDRVSAPLVRRLAGEKRFAEASQVIKSVRAVLNPEHDSQLDRELTELGQLFKR
jgi:hypothetical protein